MTTRLIIYSQRPLFVDEDQAFVRTGLELQTNAFYEALGFVLGF
jgi:hypothetical protein